MARADAATSSRAVSGVGCRTESASPSSPVREALYVCVSRRRHHVMLVARASRRRRSPFVFLFKKKRLQFGKRESSYWPVLRGGVDNWADQNWGKLVAAAILGTSWVETVISQPQVSLSFLFSLSHREVQTVTEKRHRIVGLSCHQSSFFPVINLSLSHTHTRSTHFTAEYSITYFNANVRTGLGLQQMELTDDVW